MRQKKSTYREFTFFSPSWKEQQENKSLLWMPYDCNFADLFIFSLIFSPLNIWSLRIWFMENGWQFHRESNSNDETFIDLTNGFFLSFWRHRQMFSQQFLINFSGSCTIYNKIFLFFLFFWHSSLILVRVKYLLMTTDARMFKDWIRGASSCHLLCQSV